MLLFACCFVVDYSCFLYWRAPKLESRHQLHQFSLHSFNYLFDGLLHYSHHFTMVFCKLVVVLFAAAWVSDVCAHCEFQKASEFCRVPVFFILSPIRYLPIESTIRRPGVLFVEQTMPGIVVPYVFFAPLRSCWRAVLMNSHSGHEREGAQLQMLHCWWWNCSKHLLCQRRPTNHLQCWWEPVPYRGK